MKRHHFLTGAAALAIISSTATVTVAQAAAPGSFSQWGYITMDDGAELHYDDERGRVSSVP